jgi:hypothetical protein
MRNKFSLFLITMTLMVVAIVPIGAEVTATYVQDPYLYFTTGSSPFSSSQFVAHLGTLSIFSSTNKMFTPSLFNLTASNTISFTGPITWSNDWQTGLPIYTNSSTTGKIVAVTNYNGNTNIIDIWGNSTTQPLTNTNGNLNTSLFVADFYILSYQSSSIYKPGATYPLDTATPWTFNVGVAKNGSGGYYNNLDFVSVNGVSLPSNGNPPSPVTVNSNQSTPLPYVDPSNPYSSANYLLTILEDGQFTVDNALGTKTTKAAKAQVVVSDATDGASLGVYITFKDNNNDSSFSLGLDGSKSIYTIGYTLKFLSEVVQGNVPILWNTMVEGINQQDIMITGIDAQEAELAPAGDYSDTLTVTITPIDTV